MPMVWAASLLFFSARQSAATINVFAAASLKEAFTTISHAYEISHPGVKVNLNFAGSQLLSAQINGGAMADVFASAAQKNLDQIKFTPLSRRVFVNNTLTIVVRTGLPPITAPQDLSKVGKLVVADQAVPVGHYSEIFLASAAKKFGASWLKEVQSKIVSREQDVKAVLAKVKLGEADAGIVYVSDATTAGSDVVQIPIPADINTIAQYPVAIPSSARNSDGSKDFIKFLFTADAQQEFEKDGFLSPLRAPSFIEVTERTKVRHAPVPFDKLPQLTVTATGHGGVPQSYSGPSVIALIGKTKALTATFIAADDYQQTIQISDLRSHKAILVKSEDGNYQLIVPGYAPSFWVQWVRRIELK